MTVHLGRVVAGKYHLDEVIGSGGMATVYRASHTNGHAVAIKILHPELALRADLRDRFLREGYISNAVPHEGAVSVIDDGVLEEGRPFLILELLEGETLEARSKRANGRLEVAEILDRIDQLLSILEAAHSRGIVHRDIKPSNLFVTNEGSLKLLDFGIARMLDAEGSSQTATGAVPGSPAFMAPEQALGFASEIDARTDLFAVGSTMFWLLAGRAIHVARTAAELHMFACSRPAPPLRTVAPAVPEGIASVVDRLLSFSKDDRPATATAARALLAEARSAKRRRSGAVGRWSWVVVAAVALTMGGFTLASRPATRSSEEREAPLVAHSSSAEHAPPVEVPRASAVESSSSEASAAPRAKVSGEPPVRAKARPREQDAAAPVRADPCEPPYYVDPETGTRRVRPGC